MVRSWPVEYNILDYGAVPDGRTNAACPLARAVRDAAAAGGGRVVVPAGRFLSGSVLLESNVELYLAAGAVLMSSLDPGEILPFPHVGEGDGVDGWNGGFFLGACGAQNVTISGPGVIDGQGARVFTDADADSGFHECPKAAAAFRPRMLLFEDVENLTVQDVTLRDAAFWTLHMAGCRNVCIERVRILNDERGANNDGIDPDCCRNVVISGCVIQTGDDAIVVKSTGAMARRYGACENIVISNCVMRCHSSALKIGTETHGVIRGVVMGNCAVQGCSRGVGVWVRDGGIVEQILVHHLAGSTRRWADAYALPGAPGWWGKGEPLFVSAARRTDGSGPAGTIRGISFDHIDMISESCAFFAGEPESRPADIRVSNLRLTLRRQGTQPGGLFDEQPSPRGRYAHTIPGLYARCVNGLTVTESSVRFEGEGEPWDEHRAAVLEDCRRARVRLRAQL